MRPGEEEKVRELLFTWGLDEETICTFLDNSMDLFALQHMDERTLEILVPRLGQRIRLEKQWKEWLKNSDFGAGSSTTVNLHNKLTFASCSANALNHTIPMVLLQDDENDNFLLSDSLIAPDPSSIRGKIDENIKIVLGSDFKCTKPSEDVQPPKRIKIYDLESVLLSSPSGVTVLKLYEQDKKFLKDSTRDELVDCILQNELSDDMNKIIPRNRLQFLAEQIIQTFPTEAVTTYFELYRTSKTKKLTAKGKLVWKYYNLRRKLSNCGAITKVKLTSNSPNKALTSVEVNKSVAGSLCWLEQNRGNKSNWAQVLDHWKRTSKIRLHQLMYGVDVEDQVTSPDGVVSEKSKKSTAAGKSAKTIQKQKKQLTLHDYKAKYPVFQENRAYELIEIDFLTLKPEVDPLALFSEWASLQLFIAQQIQVKVPDFVLDEEPPLSNGEKTLHTLQNLCKIFPTVTISGKRKGKKSWRPSYAEVNDAFFRTYTSYLQFEETKEARREKLEAAKLTLQPFVAVIGPFDNPIQIIVCIDEFFYEVESALQAIDVVFKSFYAFHTPYPPESKQIWLFLQKVVYGISETDDDHYTGVATLVKEYQSFKARF